MSIQLIKTKEKKEQIQRMPAYLKLGRKPTPTKDAHHSVDTTSLELYLVPSSVPSSIENNDQSQSQSIPHGLQRITSNNCCILLCVWELLLLLPNNSFLGVFFGFFILAVVVITIPQMLLGSLLFNSDVQNA